MIKKNSLTILLCFLIRAMYAQTTLKADSKHDNFRYGVLKNGFTYYIRQNNDINEKISLDFIIRAGYSYEEKNENGVAHFIEHMAFNKTEHFSNVKNYLQELGLSFGSDIRARTSGLYTSLNLRVPAHKLNLVDSAFSVIYDWSGGICLDENEIEREKGIVRGEIRLRANPEQKVLDQKDKIIFNNQLTNFSKGVGDISDIEKINISILNKFLKTWYRPDRQCLIVTGNINPEIVEKKVVSAFSRLPSQGSIKKVLDTISLTGQNQFAVIKDKSIEDDRVEIYFKRNPHFVRSTIDLKLYLISELYHEIVKKRFNQISQGKQDLIEYNKIEPQTFLMNLEATQIVIRPNGENIKHGIQNVFKNLESINKYAVTIPELILAKDILIKNSNRSNASAEEISNKYLQHFVDDNLEKKIIDKEVLASITVSDIRKFSKGLDLNVNRDIIFFSSGDSFSDLNEGIIDAWIDQGLLSELEPFVPEKKITSIIEEHQMPRNLVGNLKKSYKRDSLVEVTLPDGTKLILKPSTKNSSEPSNRVVLKIFTNIGLKNYNGLDRFITQKAPEVVFDSGVNGFTKSQVNNYLSSSTVDLAPYVSDYEAGFIGRSETIELEKLCQLSYLYLCKPNIDHDAFRNWVNYEKKTTDLLISDPENAFKDSISVALYGNDYFNTSFASTLDSLSYKTFYTRYMELYRSKKITLILTGSFNLESAISVFSKYFGSISLVKNLSTGNYSNILTIKSTKRNFYHANQDQNKSLVEFYFLGRIKARSNASFELALLNTSLNFLLVNRLRSKEGLTYSVNSSLKNNIFPEPYYEFRINLDINPKDSLKVIEVLEDEVHKLRTKLLTDQDFKKIILARREEIRQELNEPNTSNRYLGKRYRNSLDLNDNYRQLENLDAQHKEDLRAFANKYLKNQLYSVFQLHPINSSISIPDDKKLDNLKDSLISLQNSKKIDWVELFDNLTSRGYPKLTADSLLGTIKQVIYKADRNYQEYSTSLIQFSDRFGRARSNATLNNDAYEIFLYSKNSEELRTALGWSRSTINGTNDKDTYPLFLDTYAKLLYKIGDRDSAIVYMKNAILNSRKSNRIYFVEMLHGFNTGEIIWNDNPSLNIRTDSDQFRNTSSRQSWKTIDKFLRSTVSKREADSIGLIARVKKSRSSGNWADYTKYITRYLRKFNGVLMPLVLDGYAMEILHYSKKVDELKTALIASKNAIKDSNSKKLGNYLSTYSYLLYNLNMKEMAIELIKRSIDISPPSSQAKLSQNLKKMVDGDPIITTIEDSIVDAYFL